MLPMVVMAAWTGRRQMPRATRKTPSQYNAASQIIGDVVKLVRAAAVSPVEPLVIRTRTLPPVQSALLDYGASTTFGLQLRSEGQVDDARLALSLTGLGGAE